MHRHSATITSVCGKEPTDHSQILPWNLAKKLITGTTQHKDTTQVVIYRYLIDPPSVRY